MNLINSVCPLYKIQKHVYQTSKAIRCLIRGQATSHAGGVASLAEERKAQKYASFDSTHLFTPVAIETAGVIGPKSLVFLKDLGRRLRQETREEEA